MESIKQLEHYAHDIVLNINRLLIDQNIIEEILNLYRQFCSSEGARKLGISEKLITNETRLRIHFECLCFSTFCALLQSSHFLTENSQFVVNQKHYKLFDGVLATELIELCRDAGMNNLSEIVITAITPEVKFGYGDNVNPLNRLEEYRRWFVKKRGSELERFGKRIGMSLDPPHYPLLEMIGGCFGELLQLSQEAMENAKI